MGTPFPGRIRQGRADVVSAWVWLRAHVRQLASGTKFASSGTLPRSARGRRHCLKAVTRGAGGSDIRYALECAALARETIPWHDLGK